YVLATHDRPNGAKDRYELIVGSARGDASLRVSSEYDRDRPFLGFQVLELDKASAEKRGVRPYTGLLVKGTYPQSSALLAGVLAGDILLSIDGKETVYVPQLAEIEARLAADQKVHAKVLRGQNEMDLELSAQVLRERVTDSQDVALETPKVTKAYAGVNLRGIPTVWTEKIYGTPRNAVVVTNVEVGSPAWTAGIRGGDVIEAVDGAPVPPVQELARAIASRGEQGQSMRWRVTRGPGEAFEGDLALHDYSGETKVWFPLVFWLEDGAYSDSWSVGPFGLLLNNRNNYVADSSTRAVKCRNVFNAVLGLIHVETGPEETEVRLLWFISFNT
ncbi:MAG: PDZ domain-containing protein, partial [Planctomycetes bacterium]|nr:PDZ domain-containing protein [Planctomycetota bacterium]